ncbi:ubiquitin-like-specific protease [Acrasis kona]|uniref:Ubiquitin-like-specific protease n=1 Tax=Acrasis kona TaxID=1008807 RepID=A0AAW2ZF55_9EUKA
MPRSDKIHVYGADDFNKKLLETLDKEEDITKDIRPRKKSRTAAPDYVNSSEDDEPEIPSSCIKNIGFSSNKNRDIVNFDNGMHDPYTRNFKSASKKTSPVGKLVLSTNVRNNTLERVSPPQVKTRVIPSIQKPKPLPKTVTSITIEDDGNGSDSGPKHVPLATDISKGKALIGRDLVEYSDLQFMYSGDVKFSTVDTGSISCTKKIVYKSFIHRNDRSQKEALCFAFQIKPEKMDVSRVKVEPTDIGRGYLVFIPSTPPDRFKIAFEQLSKLSSCIYHQIKHEIEYMGKIDVPIHQLLNIRLVDGYNSNVKEHILSKRAEMEKTSTPRSSTRIIPTATHFDDNHHSKSPTQTPSSSSSTIPIDDSKSPKTNPSISINKSPTPLTRIIRPKSPIRSPSQIQNKTFSTRFLQSKLKKPLDSTGSQVEDDDDSSDSDDTNNTSTTTTTNQQSTTFDPSDSKNQNEENHDDDDDVKSVSNPQQLVLEYHKIPLINKDLDRLNPGEFLNDNIIDFYLQHLYMTKEHEPSFPNRFHLFHSTFYPLMKKDPVRAAKRIPNPNFKLFDTDFIFIPANEEQHWMLFIVCYPKTNHRCIMYCDSLGFSAKKEMLDLVNEYLRNRFLVEMPNTEAIVPTFRNVNALLPKQENMCDCGVFLLHYVETFLSRWHNYKPKELPIQDAEWFSLKDIAMKRNTIRDRIYALAADEVCSSQEVEGDDEDDDEVLMASQPNKFTR